MTEVDWLACEDPLEMLGFLRGELVTLVDGIDGADERERMRRHVRRLLADRKSRQLVVECTRRAGGVGAIAGSADDSAHPTASTGRFLAPAELAARSVARAAPTAGRSSALRWHDVAKVVEDCAYAAVWGGTFPTLADAGRWQGTVVRDIFGNPFRLATLEPCSLAVVALARTIDDERAFDRLPELADALERQGYTDADVLAHCRGPGPHVRGCWVVDLVLGHP